MFMSGIRPRPWSPKCAPPTPTCERSTHTYGKRSGGEAARSHTKGAICADARLEEMKSGVQSGREEPTARWAAPGDPPALREEIYRPAFGVDGTEMS